MIVVKAFLDRLRWAARAAGAWLVDATDVDKDRRDGLHGICFACGRERWDLEPDGICPTCFGRTAP